MSEATFNRGETVVEIDGVTRRFGAVTAMDDVVLSVPRGTVFGLVGVNGAGKTTLLKHVLGLLKARTGRISVFGIDPVADPVGVLSKIGYLSEESDLPGWMRVDELIRYTRGFYPKWDDRYAEELRRSFGLDLSKRIKHLSKGQRARAGLLIALAFRPELLVLDEPSSGLDPIVRRDILGAIIRTISEEGRTVLFSSHLLGEVERVSDHVAMMDEGRIVISGRMDHLKETFRRLTVRFDNPRAGPPTLRGAMVWQGAGHEWTTVCDGKLDIFRTAVEEAGARIVEEKGASLDEIFLAKVGVLATVSEEE
jgi:ABC-type multidrug transport system ATPase subunit